MSVLTIALIALAVVVVLGLVLVIADCPIWGVERYGVSIRELPNVASPVGAADIGASDTHPSDRDSARR